MALLHADGSDTDDRLRIFVHVVVHSQIADPKLPGSHRIGPHGLAVPRLDSGLMGELLIDDIQNRGAVVCREGAQMMLRGGRIVDSITQTVIALSSFQESDEALHDSWQSITIVSAAVGPLDPGRYLRRAAFQGMIEDHAVVSPDSKPSAEVGSAGLSATIGMKAELSTGGA